MSFMIALVVKYIGQSVTKSKRTSMFNFGRGKRPLIYLSFHQAALWARHQFKHRASAWAIIKVSGHRIEG